MRDAVVPGNAHMGILHGHAVGVLDVAQEQNSRGGGPGEEPADCPLIGFGEEIVLSGTGQIKTFAAGDIIDGKINIP